MEQMQPESSRQIGTLIGIVKFFTIPIPTKFSKWFSFMASQWISSHLITCAVGVIALFSDDWTAEYSRLQFLLTATVWHW